MATRPTRLKRISKNDTVFFVFQIDASNYALYDSGMGDPIKYDSIALILGVLNDEMKLANIGKRKRFKVYWMIRDAVKGWKKNIQPPAGYSIDGILDKMPICDKNSVNIQISKPRGFPTPDVDQFYWFFLGAQGRNVHYLYDEDMGSPVWGENKQKLIAFLQEMDSKVREGKRKKYALWCLERANENEFWEKKSAKWIPQFTIESTKKAEIVDEKKKEQPKEEKSGQ